MDDTKLFDALRWDEIELPKAIKCINCGGVTRLEDVESNEYQVTHFYQCDNCDAWTEWEIANDDGDIKYSTLGLRESVDSEIISQMELRGGPFMWIPDGVIVPREGQVQE